MFQLLSLLSLSRYSKSSNNSCTNNPPPNSSTYYIQAHTIPHTPTNEISYKGTKPFTDKFARTD